MIEEGGPKERVDLFHGRFEALAAEARAEGIEAVWALSYDDRLSDDFWHIHGWTCGPFVAIGMAEKLKARALREVATPSED
jgi:hypothetical protein